MMILLGLLTLLLFSVNEIDFYPVQNQVILCQYRQNFAYLY